MHLCTQTIVWAHIFVSKCTISLVMSISIGSSCYTSYIASPSLPWLSALFLFVQVFQFLLEVMWYAGVQYSIILMSKAAPSSLQVYWKLCGMQGMLLRAGKIYKIYMQGMQGMLERYTKRGSCCQVAQINDMEELERLIKTLLRRTSL